MDKIEKNLLEQVAGLHEVPAGAYNIRANGKMAGRGATANIEIVTKEDKQGIDIRIKAGTKRESVHIPVILSETGYQEMVYNDFYIGEDCDVTIISGCGIHNCGADTSKHDGIHTCYVGKNAKVPALTITMGNNTSIKENERGGSGVKSTYCSSRSPEFNFQQPSVMGSNALFIW